MRGLLGLNNRSLGRDRFRGAVKILAHLVHYLLSCVCLNYDYECTIEVQIKSK